MANAKVLEHLRGLQAEKGNLIKAAQDAIKELNEVGKYLGFSYSLTLDGDDQTANPPKSTGGSTGTRTQMKPEDIKAAKETILDHLRTKPSENTQAAIFTAADWPKTSWQTYGKHLEALVKAGFVIKSNKTDNFKVLEKGKSAAAVNAHNPYVYKWAKDLDD